MLEINPDVGTYHLRLGHVYYRLAASAEGNGESERYFELAEENLRVAARPGATGSDATRANVFFLGNLYRNQDRPEEAIAAYEKALE